MGEFECDSAFLANNWALTIALFEGLSYGSALLFLFACFVEGELVVSHVYVQLQPDLWARRTPVTPSSEDRPSSCLASTMFAAYWKQV